MDLVRTGFRRSIEALRRVAGCAILSAVALFAAADEAPAGGIHVSAVWARATPPVSSVGAAYLSLANHGVEEDRLIGASSPVAGRVALHAHAVDAGMMTMRPVDSVALRAGETVTFAPGGNHIMLLGLKHPLRAGDRFPLTLELERGGSLRVEVRVRPAGAAAADAGD